MVYNMSNVYVGRLEVHSFKSFNPFTQVLMSSTRHSLREVKSTSKGTTPSSYLDQKLCWTNKTMEVGKWKLFANSFHCSPALFSRLGFDIELPHWTSVRLVLKETNNRVDPVAHLIYLTFIPSVEWLARHT